jgi:glycyl-tRNA synthetase
MWEKAKEKGLKSPDGNSLGSPRNFNMMFKTQVGAAEDTSAVSYLRPETAQGIFVNFKNIIDTFHPNLPFGIAQIGKAFRNEITPREFLFRIREMEQMEVEYFIYEDGWEKHFDEWKDLMWQFISDIGIDEKKVHELDVSPADRAHYSKKTTDFEFDFPFGRKELFGLAYRTDYDLKKHAKHSKTDLSYFDQKTGDRFTPHVIEPSLGVDRAVLAVLCSAYTEDELGEGKRAYLNLSYEVAPYKVAVFPLLKNRPELVLRAKAIYQTLKKDVGKVMFDDNGNIGKRYRRQDEIGTPVCITVDFDSLEDSTVTVRDRNSGVQKRIKESAIDSYLKDLQKK